MFTADGLSWLVGVTVESLAGVRLYVTDGAEGKHSERADITVDGTEIVLTATFGEDVANYEWRTRAAILPDQTVIDQIELGDQGGRKAQGQIWVCEHRIDLAAE